MRIVVLLCMLAPLTAAPAIAQQAIRFSSDAGMVTNQVKPTHVREFEAGITAVRQALANSNNPVHREQAKTWKVYRAAEQMGASVLYVFIIDKAVSGADYSLGSLLSAMPRDEADRTLIQIGGSLAAGQNMVNLSEIKGPALLTSDVAAGSQAAVTSSSDVPTAEAAAPGIRAKCAAEWRDDFQMRAYCEKQQNEALSKLRTRTMASTDERTIRNKCTREWPGDFQMQNYCEEQQLKALAIVQ